MTFPVILIDPPWKFKTFSGKNSLPHRTANDHYSTMTLKDLKALPVGKLAAPDTALIMWVVDSHFDQALELAAAWGFSFKTCLLVWVKTTNDGAFLRMSMGYYSRKQTEQAWLFTKGKPKRVGKGVRQVILAPRREHSRKPDEQYERIEALFNGPYVELFSRTTRKGWKVRGNDTARWRA